MKHPFCLAFGCHCQLNEPTNKKCSDKNLSSNALPFKRHLWQAALPGKRTGKGMASALLSAYCSTAFIFSASIAAHLPYSKREGCRPSRATRAGLLWASRVEGVMSV